MGQHQSLGPPESGQADVPEKSLTLAPTVTMQSSLSFLSSSISVFSERNLDGSGQGMTNGI